MLKNSLQLSKIIVMPYAKYFTLSKHANIKQKHYKVWMIAENLFSGNHFFFCIYKVLHTEKYHYILEFPNIQ